MAIQKKVEKMEKMEFKSKGEEMEFNIGIVEELRAIKPLAFTDATISIKSLLGTWVNCDSDTRGIVRIEFREEKGMLMVHVFGKCHPSPCDWGVVFGTPYAESIVHNEAIAFSAFYDQGFSECIVTGHLDFGTLIVETFNKFKDGSGRSNYYSRAYLCKRNSINEKGC